MRHACYLPMDVFEKSRVWQLIPDPCELLQKNKSRKVISDVMLVLAPGASQTYEMQLTVGSFYDNFFLGKAEKRPKTELD